MTDQDALRGLCRAMGGDTVDLWTLADRAAAALADRRRRGDARATPRDVVRDVVTAALADRARDGDTAARDQLLALWQPELARWAAWLCPRDAHADDVAHDALVRVCERLPRLRDPDRFAAWAWGLVRNVAREHGRRSTWRRWTSWFTGGPEAPEPADPGRGPEATLRLSERAEQVRQVLAGLAADDRELLWLHYVEDVGREEIALRTGLSRGTLNRRLTAARRAFEQAAARIALEPGETP